MAHAPGSGPAAQQPPFVHSEAACDACGCNPIRTAVRYKCLQCPNYDLCSDCEERLAALTPQPAAASSSPFPAFPPSTFPAPPTSTGPAATHDPHTHIFLKLRRPACDYPVGNYLVQPRAGLVHAGVTCSSCRRGVVGIRYTCQVCPDLHLCEACELSAHHARLQHAMTKVYLPITASAPGQQPPIGSPGVPSSGFPTAPAAPPSAWAMPPPPPATKSLVFLNSSSATAVASSSTAPLPTRVLASLGSQLLRLALQPPPTSGAWGVSTSAGPDAAFVSPLSIYVALTLAVNGTGLGSTSQQELLRLLSGQQQQQQQQQAATAWGQQPLQVFQVQQPAVGQGQQQQQQLQQQSQEESALNAGLHQLMQSLMAGGLAAVAADAGRCTVLLANGVFSKPGFSPRPEYAQSMATLFQASCHAVQDRGPINQWVNAQTQGQIASILDDDEFDLVLVNALFFKGTWKKAFDAGQTRPRLFHAPSGPRSVMMMTGTFDGSDAIKVVSAPNCYIAAELPYQDGCFSAVAILPEQGVALADAVHAWCNGSAVKQERTPRSTIVVMPKFRAEHSAELSDALKGMGVQSIFDKQTVDLSRLWQAPDIYRNYPNPTPLVVTKVLHKTVVDVDERGTVAAAVTAVVSVFFGSCAAPEPPLVLTFDRPFAFAIRHNATLALLFVGAVMAPPRVG